MCGVRVSMSNLQAFHQCRSVGAGFWLVERVEKGVMCGVGVSMSGLQAYHQCRSVSAGLWLVERMEKGVMCGVGVGMSTLQACHQCRSVGAGLWLREREPGERSDVRGKGLHVCFTSLPPMQECECWSLAE